jgi:hydrogenase expression/formation protein HypE
MRSFRKVFRSRYEIAGRAVGLPPGKLSPELLASLLADLPAGPEVLLGPAEGEDGCALRVGGETLVAATDPITFTGRDAGRLAVLVNANDVAVTGARPQWFLAVVLLPVGTTEDEVRTLFAEMRVALDEVGASLVGGHSEVTPAVDRTVVVGQMSGTTGGGRLVRTGGAVAGDVLVQVGPVPVEGAAVLAPFVDSRGRAGVDDRLLQLAADALRTPGISVVEPALAAAALGATSLHDPTEGGLAGGLHEVARASGVAAVVDLDRVLWFEPGVAVCRAAGADPLATLASGALLAAFGPSDANGAVERLGELGFEASRIGVLQPGEGVREVTGAPVPRPARDEVARLFARDQVFPPGLPPP